MTGWLTNMPSVSKKQHNFMAAIAHSPSFAKKAGVPQSVGRDFIDADKTRDFNKGGKMRGPQMDAAMMPRRRRAMPKPDMNSPMGGPMMKNGGMVKQTAGSASSRADGIASKGKTKGKQVKMAGGGKC